MLPRRLIVSLVALATLVVLCLFLSRSTNDTVLRARHRIFHHRAAVPAGYDVEMYSDPSDLSVGEVSHLQWAWKRLGSYAAYEKQNQTLTDQPHRVVLMGDSLTFYWAERSDALKGKPYLDRGVGLNTSADVLLRFQPDVINLHPEAVVIGVGTNDIYGIVGVRTAEWTENNIKSAVDIATANHIAVALADIPPYVGLTPELDAKRRAINDWSAGYSATRGIPYARYSSVLSDESGRAKPALFSDGIHPNQKGYALMKPLLEKAIEEAQASHQRQSQ